MNTLEISQQTALDNCHACIRQMPRSLRVREKKLFKFLKKSNHDPIKMLWQLYAFMDDLYAFVQNYTPCKKGCSNCCRIPISVTELDVYFIERSLRIKRNKIKLAILPEIPCPFLVSNSCSIYMYRPFVCRKNVTFDNSAKWCHAKLGANAAMPLLQFDGIERAYHHLVNISGANKIYDIRDIFARCDTRSLIRTRFQNACMVSS
jgi:Fe-S-cluster containining protein